MPRKSKRYTATTMPVGIGCGSTSRLVVGALPPVKGGRKCGGLMNRVTLSRLEESLGHEGFECAKCGRRIKRVPKEQV